MRGLYSYSKTQLGDFWENDLEPAVGEKCEKKFMPYKGMIETMENIGIVKDSDELPNGMEKAAKDMVEEVEDEVGIKIEDVPDPEDWESAKLILKIFFKHMLPKFWKSRNRFWVMKSVIYYAIRCGSFMIISKIINPLVWFRFWKGYYESYYAD